VGCTPTWLERLSSNSERRAWLDEQYSPSRTAHNFAGSLLAAKEGTDASRRQISGARHRFLKYGTKPAQQIECFLPEAVEAQALAPIFAFLHGGWWQEGSISDAGAPARAITHCGAAYASIGYTLAPAASLRQIVAEVAAALEVLAEAAEELGGDPRRIVVAGHSAGAHLAAAQLTALVPASAREAVSGLLLIGGAYDLAPIAESYVNEKLGLSAAEAAELSPAALTPLRDVPVRIRVGQDEPAEFHRNAALLAERWSPHLRQIDLRQLDGRDHFDLLDELADPSGRLFSDAVALLGLPPR